METPAILISPAPADVARLAADLVVSEARAAIEARGRFVLALSGGSTPRALYERLGTTLAGAVDWSRTFLVFGDERCVPPTDPDSNYAMAARALIERVPIPEGNVLRVHGDDGDHQRAAADYDRRLRVLLGVAGAIDLVLLGMGADGHTASLFPTPPEVETPDERLVIPVHAPPSSPVLRRVTLSYAALRRARRVLALVTGAEKAERLREILAGEAPGLPMSRVIHDRGGQVELLLDRAVAAHLSDPSTSTKQESSDMEQTDFGVIGLAVMGENLALNIEEKGFSISVYNRSPDRVDAFLAENPGKRVRGAHSFAELAQQLRRPRRMVMMVKAGAPVDATIEGLLPYLEPGDVLIDGGNEFYTNTERRSKLLSERGIHFVGMGVSGGEEGARHGPSMMPGGPREAYDKIADVVTKIAAQVADGPCVTYIGPGGAGHYVKMVHNGIEYGDMQLIAEIYDVLKHIGGLSNPELAEVFASWNAAELESYLIEITARIFTKQDPETGAHLVDLIVDEASMKGTGKWTVQEGAELSSPIPTIAAAVDARVMSSQASVRKQGARLLAGPRPTPVPASERPQLIADARAAMYAAKACSYAQGMALLATASKLRGWDLDLGGIARIWKGGCIIRAAFLGKIQEAFAGSSDLANLLFAPSFRDALAARQEGWRRLVGRTISEGIAAPALTTSLSYYDGIRRERTPASLIQAQRDFFGAHTYRRIDREGAFHTEWST